MTGSVAGRAQGLLATTRSTPQPTSGERIGPAERG
jgi:hypothetical protein